MIRNSVQRRSTSVSGQRNRRTRQAVAVLDALEHRRLFTALAVWNFNDGSATNTAPLLTVDRVTPGVTAGLTTNIIAANVSSFAGSTVNADSGDVAGQALAVVGNTSNGAYITFTTTTTGYNNVSVSFATQGTGTGFKTNQFQYSTDGTTFTNLGSTYAPPTAFALQSFDLSAIPGLSNDPNAAFRIIFSGATGAGGNNRIDNLIVAGTALPVPLQPVAFNAPSYTVPENAGTVSLTITRGAANGTDLTGDESVTYTTGGGTATAGTNYTATTGTAVFHSGDSSTTISVPILDAANMGGNQTFTVTLSNPTLANGSAGVTATLGPQATATVTILDTTEGFQFTTINYTTSDILNPTANTPGAAIVSVLRNGYLGDAASISFATSDGTAVAGTDYTATSGTLGFSAGQAVATFSVPVNDVSTAKTFGLTLSNPTAQPGDFPKIVGASTATTTIVNVGQINPTLTGSPTSSVNIEASGPFTSNFAIVNGDLTGTSSFAFLSYPLLTFDKTTTPGLYPVGSSTVTSLNGLSLQLNNTATSGTFAGHPGNINIYFIGDATVATSALSYDTTKFDGFAAAQYNFTAGLVALGSFSFVSSQVGYETYATSNLSPAAQSAISTALNSGKSFRLAITPDGTGVGATAADYSGVTGTPSAPPILSFSGTTSVQVESFNLSTAAVTVNKTDPSVVVTIDRSTISPGDLTDTASVLVTTINGSAASGTDFTGGNYLANFASGATATTVTIPLLNNAAVYGDKSFAINLSSPAVTGSGRTGALVAPTSEIVSIRDVRTTNVFGSAEALATVQTTGPRANAGTVVANNFFNIDGAQSTDPSFGVADFNDSTSDPDGTYRVNLPSGQTVGTINTVSIGLIYAPQSGVSKNGLFNVYLVDDSTTSISNTGGSPLTFNTSADAIEGLGGQLGTKHLLGSFTFNTTQSQAVFTYFPLSSVDATTKGLLVADLNNQTKFRLAVTPADSPADNEAGTFRGLATFSGLYEAPQLAFNFTPAGTVTNPTYFSSTSVYTYDAGSNTATVTGAATIISDPGTALPNIVVTSTGVLTINTSTGSQVQLNSLNLAAGSVTSISTARQVVLELKGSTNSLTTASGAKLDIGRSDLVVTGGSLSAISGLVQAGFNLGTFTGTGITSSVAAANTLHTTAVGVVANSVLGKTAFDGDPSVGPTDILVKYTYFGDANLDGKVDGSDYSRIDFGFLNAGSTGWYNGNFNYDTTVDGSDYTLIDNAYNRQGAAQVFSPSSLLAKSAVLSTSPTFSDRVIKADKKETPANLFGELVFTAR